MNVMILTLKIVDENDVLLARQRVRQIASLIGFDLHEQTRIATAVSEITRNALIYGKGGDVQFFIENETPTRIFVIRIKDKGPGIPNLDDILAGHTQAHPTRGLGLGIIGSRRLMDRFHIVSNGTEGTTVVMGKYLPINAPPITKHYIRELTDKLLQQTNLSYTEAVHQQNKELLYALDELRHRDEKLTAINVELEKTNRGVVALYAELDEQKKWLSTLLASIGDAVIATDENGFISLVNPAAQKLTGWSQEDAERVFIADVFNVLNQETHQPIEGGWDSIQYSGELPTQAILQTKHGMERYIESNVTSIYNDKEEFKGAVLTFRDISRRKQTERDLRQSYQQTERAYEAERKAREDAERAKHRIAFLAEASTLLASSLDYQTTLDNLGQLIVPQFADTYVIDLLNEQNELQRVAIYATDPVTEQTLRDMPQLYPSSPLGSINDVLQRKEPILVSDMPLGFTENVFSENSLLNAQQVAILRQVHTQSYMNLPLIVQDQTIGVLSVGVSNRRFDQDDLTLGQELARRMAQAIENARLYAQLKQAVRARDEFLSVAAHELRTPVTSMRGFAQLILRQLQRQGEVSIAQLKSGLGRIDEQSAKLSDLIGRLLDISRLESGRLVLEKGAFDLPKLVSDVAANIQKNSKQYTIAVNSPPELTITADPLRIEQVLVNLLDNAVKYSADSRKIDVEIRPEKASVFIAVRDYGVGIPPERRARIFDRFYQAHGDGYLGGMGLGLYISNQIVELHGGTLTVDAPNGGGSCFIITLPFE